MDIGPYNIAEAITKSDTVDITAIKQRGLPDAIYVGGAGVVIAVMDDSSTQAFTCIAGQVLPIAIRRVNSTSTTATLMIALWRQ